MKKSKLKILDMRKKIYTNFQIFIQLNFKEIEIIQFELL